MGKKSSRLVSPAGFGLAVVLVLAIFLMSASYSEAQAPRHCQPVVKKIYRLTDGEPPFYKAKVLIVHGSIRCETARRIIWKTLIAGGFYGHVNEWECAPKGEGEEFAEKCARRDATTGEREVIKSSQPRSCPRCTANRY